LLRGKFSEVVMRLAEQALDEHKRDVGLSRTSLYKDDRPESLVRVKNAFGYALLETPLQKYLFYYLFLVSVRVLDLSLIYHSLGFVIGNGGD
jgi:hypothetical protein